MRRFALFLALASVLFLAGCSSLVSLNQFVTDGEAALDPALPGLWADPDGGLYAIQKDGAGYAIRYTNKDGEASKFKARTAMAGDVELMDLWSADDNPFQLQVHTPIRIWVAGSTLRMAFLDSDWLKKQAAQQLPTTPADDNRTLIVAPGDAVRGFLLKAGADSKAYKAPEDGLRKLQ